MGLAVPDMVWYAIERIDDAVSLTRSLLFPFQAGLWARLAVVVFFVGMGSGGGNVGSSVSNAPSAGTSFQGGDFSFEPSVSLSGEALTAIGAIAVVLVVLWLVFAWIGATMEFVFVEALGEQSLSIRRGFGRHRSRGFRLLLFRLVLFLAVAVLFVGLALALFFEPITTLLSGGSPSVTGGELVVGIGLLVLSGFVVGLPLLLIHGFTTEFVVPVMLTRDCGVLAGWSHLWPTIKAEWKQYVVYVVLAFGLRIATSIAGGIVIGILAVVLAIPFVVVGLLFGFGAITSGTLTTSLVVGIVLLALAFFLVVALAGALVYVPIQSFHRYFALLFVGDVESDFDVLEDLRPALEGDIDPSSAA